MIVCNMVFLYYNIIGVYTHSFSKGTPSPGVLSDKSTKGEGVHMHPPAYDTMNNYSNIIQIL